MPSGTKPNALTAFSGAVARASDLGLIWDESAGLLKKLSWSQVRQGVFDVLDYGADPTGTDNSTAAIQAAIDAAGADPGGEVYIPPGTYRLDTALTNTSAYPLKISGAGSSTVLQPKGATNKALYISGTPGVTIAKHILKDFRIVAANSGTCAAGIHLDGVALFWLQNIVIDGASKMTNCIQCTGSQQGTIHGGYLIAATNGIKLEDEVGEVSSNGLSITGVSLGCSAVNILVAGTDSLFIIGNHLTSAAIGIDVTAGGNGAPVIMGNHIESHTTGGVRAAAEVRILDNNFYPGESGVDILLTGGSRSVVMGNEIFGDATIEVGAQDTIWANNFSAGSGTFTNSSTTTTIYGNRGTTGAIAKGAVLFDALTLTSRAAAAGTILELKPNAAVAGAWGMKIGGAGSGKDVYVQLNDAVLAGVTSGNVLKVMSGVEGTQWAAFKSSGIELGASGAPIMCSAAATPENAITAPIGSLCIANVAGTGKVFVKASGTGNTGWVELAKVS